MVNKPRAAVARSAARKLLVDFGVQNLPVPVELIAAGKTNGPVTEFGGFAAGMFGAMSRRGNELMIVVSSECPNQGHRRFTIAHEIGHLVIDGHLDQFLQTDQELFVSPPSWARKRPPAESEADIFAAELLLPSKIIRPIVNRMSLQLESIVELSRTAISSVSAAAIAFATIHPDPVAIVMTKNRDIEWVAASESMIEETSLDPWRARGEWAPQGSAAAQLSRNPKSVLAGDTASSYGLLCEWFEDAPDIDISEDCVGLGSFGRCMSLITCD